MPSITYYVIKFNFIVIQTTKNKNPRLEAIVNFVRHKQAVHNLSAHNPELQQYGTPHLSAQIKIEIMTTTSIKRDHVSGSQRKKQKQKANEMEIVDQNTCGDRST